MRVRRGDDNVVPRAREICESGDCVRNRMIWNKILPPPIIFRRKGFKKYSVEVSSAQKCDLFTSCVDMEIWY
jgi:hypothetical protein